MENGKESDGLDFRALIEECRASGQTVRNFCESRGVREQQFYYHKQKLEGRRATKKSQIIRLGLPVREAGHGGYEINRDGVTLRIPARFEIEQVKVLLELLGK